MRTRNLKILYRVVLKEPILAGQFAAEMSIPLLVFKPDYQKYGRGATLVRNTQIIENAEVVFAFWDGQSKGTKDSIKKAEKLEKELYIIKYKQSILTP